MDYIKQNNINLLITAKANAVAVAEHVMALVLSISKAIKIYDKEVRVGNFKKNAKSISTLELFNKEILIAGFGRIGKSLIKRCLNFDMKEEDKIKIILNSYKKTKKQIQYFKNTLR